jgi:hypothetical protein
MKVSSILIAIGVTFLGCSSSSGSGGSGGDNCGKVAACGGNIVGTWTVATACAQSTAPTSVTTGSCTETTQVGQISASGTATFNSDMTYTYSLSESASETVTVPMSCLTVAGVTVTCDELQMDLGGAIKDDAGATTTTCTTSGTSCSCDVSVAGQAVTETGTYTISGDTVTTTSSTSTGTTGGGQYCVQGNTLHILSAAMGSGATATPGTDIVATK